MKIKWYQYFSIGAFVAGWLAKALAVQPGEKKPTITAAERAELGHGLVEMINSMLGGEDGDITIE